MGEGSKRWCSEIPFTSSTKIVDHVNGVNDETRRALQICLPLAGDECKCPPWEWGEGGGYDAKGLYSEIQFPKG